MNPHVVALALAVLFADGQVTLPPAVTTILQSLAGQAAAPYALDPNHVRGVVTYFKRFDLQVRLPLDRYKAIRLHQGTVINPRGTSLTEGDVVDVQGKAAADGSLDADTITLVRR